MSIVKGNHAGLGGAGAPGGPLAGGGVVYSYNIDQSLRFEESGTANLTFIPSNNGTDNKKFTYSVWIKRGQSSADDQHLIQSKNTGAGTGQGHVGFILDTSDSLDVYTQNGGVNPTGTRLLRDHAGWYHCCFVYDTTEATASDRVKVYINGDRDTLSGSFPPLNSVMSSMNYNGQEQYIGKYVAGYTRYFNGYMAEIHMVDGQVLSPTDFAEEVNGVWVPKEYADNGTISHGINGYHLTFEGTGTGTTTQGTTAQTNIGDDQSGNGNNWNANNLASTDVLLDSPTNNFATINLDHPHLNITFKEGNLRHETASNNRGVVGNFLLPKSGKWYWEHWSKAFNYAPDNELHCVGINIPEVDLDATRGGRSTGVSISSLNGNVFNESGTGTSYGSGWAENQGVAVLFDADAATISFSENGGAFGSAVSIASGTTNKDWIPFVGMGGGNSTEIGFFNFGQDGTFVGETTSGNYTDANGIGNFKWEPPADALALCTANLSEPAIGPQLASGQQADDYFETILYTGNGGTQHIGSGGAQHPQDVTTVDNSLTFNRAGEHELARTFGSGGDRRKWTFSTWIKRTALLSSGNDHYIFGTNTGAANSTFMMLVWRATDALAVTGQSTLWLKSNNSFGDTSGWYHIVWVLDSDNATNAEKMRLYVDGTELTSFATDSRSSLSGDQAVNAAVEHNLGAHPSATGYGLDAYLADTIFVDGQAYGPEQFGQIGSNGYWIPKAYSGTYGATGFKLTYEGTGTATTADGTTAQTNIGDDQSGSGRNFGIVGSTIDSHDVKIDSPTQNFATFDPNRPSGTTLTLSEGNLKAERTSTSFAQAYSTFEMTSGKWYAEFLLDTGNSGVGVIAGTTVPGTNRYLGQDSYTYSYYLDGRKVNNATYTAYGDSYTTAADGSGDVIGVLIDADNGNISFSKNGVIQNSGTPAFSGIQGPFRFAIASESNCFHIANFGQDDTFSGLKTSGSAGAADGNGYGKFYDTPPTGFLALMDDNIPVEGITGPDFVWIKSRSSAYNNVLWDTVRGATKQLITNTYGAESTQTSGLTSFDYDGFTIGSNSNLNNSGSTYVSWNWKAGGKANTFNVDGTGYASMTAAGLTDGDIALTGLSVNTTSGFSIGTYTGIGAAGPSTIAHGLGKQVQLVMVKGINNSNYSFAVYTRAGDADGSTFMNTGGQVGGTPAATSGLFTQDAFGSGSGTFDDSFFSIGGPNNYTSQTYNYLFYAFANVEGFSKHGKYVGNGSADGTFVYTGFRPAWVMLKRTDSADSWLIRDSIRNPYNVTDLALFANYSAAEYVDTTLIDFTSNGFKFRHQNSLQNASGGSYIYLAFAEQPFKYANAR
jgi:hypothetical protein